MVERRTKEGKENERYHNLVVWQVAFQLGLEVYKCTQSWPKHEIYGLTSQVRRAAVSVAANIAEGYERRRKAEFIRFLDIARGSLGEVETLLLFGVELGYLSRSDYDELEKIRIRCAKLIRGLLNSLASPKAE
jgi:four helix bundle protein